jgi:hypothetical protein
MEDTKQAVVVGGSKSGCMCRFDGCKKPRLLFSKALDGRIVVYPPNSEEARLDELMESIGEESEGVWECPDQFKETKKCLVCEKTFESIDGFIEHCRVELGVLSRRRKGLLTCRQEQPGEFLY